MTSHDLVYPFQVRSYLLFIHQSQSFPALRHML
jgi:hypothetical protein